MDYTSFESDRKTRDAVVRNLEVIGEAAKNLPEEIRRQYPDVNWKVVAGMRDRLIHEYFGVSIRITWETIKKDLPRLSSQSERSCATTQLIQMRMVEQLGLHIEVV
jgi:hypothetical protein